MLCRLSVFAGSWTLEEVEQICDEDGGESNVLDLLSRLIDKSLVSLNGSRYQMLETTRQFALEKLVESSEYEWVKIRHLDFFMNLAEGTEQKLSGVEQLNWLHRIEIEQGNLRAALKWGLENKVEVGIRVVSALWLFWFMHAHFIEGRQWYDEALSVGGNASPELRIRLLNGAASNSLGLNDVEKLTALSEQCLALSYEQQNKWGIAMSLHHLGIAAMMQGDYKRAQELLEKGLMNSREIRDEIVTSYLLNDLGVLAREKNDFESASVYYKESLALAQEREDRWSSAYALQFLAAVAYMQRNYVEADTLTRHALKIGYEIGDKRLLSGLLELTGLVAFRQGKPNRASRLLGAAAMLAESVGLPFILEDPDMLTDLHAQLGEQTLDALQLEGRAMTMEQAIGYALEVTYE